MRFGRRTADLRSQRRSQRFKSPHLHIVVEITTFGLVSGHFSFPIAQQPKALHSNPATHAYAPFQSERGGVVRRLSATTPADVLRRRSGPPQPRCASRIGIAEDRRPSKSPASLVRRLEGDVSFGMSDLCPCEALPRGDGKRMLTADS